MNFKIFVEPVVETLKGFGVAAEFTGRNDIVIDGMKISGNSQYVKKYRVMHHGCIMLDSDLEKVADALNVKAAKFKSKNSKSVRSRVTTINAHAPRKISMEEFKTALKEHILGSDGMEPYELTEEDLREIKRLRDEKYSTWAWNYGQAVQYEMTREEKLRSQDMGKYFRVCADSRDLNYDKFMIKGEVHTMADEAYTSHNTNRLDVEETVKKILTTDYVNEELEAWKQGK